MRGEKSGREWSLSSEMELVSKFTKKCFTLYDEYDITIGSFIIEVSDSLPY